MYFPYVFKELIRRKPRTTTVVLTVAVVISMLILITAVMNAYSSAIYLPFKNIGSDIILQKADNRTTNTTKIRVPFGKGIFNDEEIIFLSSLDHVVNISKSLILWNFGQKGFVSIEGVEPDSFMSEKLSSWIVKGRFITREDNNKAVLESHFANFNHLKVGDNITIGNDTFEISGILKIKGRSPIFSSNIYLKLSDSQRISGIRGYNQIYLKVDDLANEELIKSEIKHVDNKIEVISGNSISASLGRY